MPRSTRHTCNACNCPGNRKWLLRLASALLPVLLAAGCGPTAPVPTDAQDSCAQSGQPLTAAIFATWFQSGTVTLNGAVNPADSTQALQPDCGFYHWSEQMFLWLTSPAPPSYGGGAHIFDSPTFYDVSPPDASGKRTLLAHTAGFMHAFPLRVAKLGPNRLPVVIDRSGRMFEVKRVDPNLKPLVREPSGRVVQIAHVRLENGRPVLLDTEGRIIAAQHLQSALPATDKRGTTRLIAQKFVIDNIPIFIDPSLAVIDVEQGQAGDSSVLQAQTTANGSLVYYATMVNDVYAYFVTGVKKGAINTVAPNQFPTTTTDRDAIVNFATSNGKPNPPFPDPNALAIEVKSAWVVASGLPNLSSYITTTATIPTYDTSNSNLWTPTGQQTVQLALVGMHVVGSTAGHPEMVWATFEHTGNTPLNTYKYTTNTNATNTVNQNTSGTWLFTSNGSGGPFNVPHMSFTGPNGTPANAVQSEAGFSISPSDTLRQEPFGVDGGNVFENTEVISTDHLILSFLASGDIRGNYIMTGATWTPFGSNPTFSNLGVGTNLLANTTMETYAQGSNCFGCHQNLNPNPAPACQQQVQQQNPTATQCLTTEVSHIFWGDTGLNTPEGIQPLF